MREFLDVPIATTPAQAFAAPMWAYLTVPQFSAKYPAWSEAALRNLIFLAKERETSRGRLEGNGLAPAIVRCGRKVLIDERAFFAWVEAQQEPRRAA